MKCVLFYHAFSSCWNNGNAHFVRGVARELASLGHQVVVYEPGDGWSRSNALADGGADALVEVTELFADVEIRVYEPTLDLDEALDGADLVLVHEWNPPELIAEIGRRRLSGSFVALFHDTHHRAVTAPDEMARFELDGFDGVLAFGEALRQIYQQRGWARRAFTWHEAADTALYHPLPDVARTDDLVWIGNWGDGERSAELAEFLIGPVAALGLRAAIHGVRYSREALSAIKAAGIAYRGWLPAHRVPEAFAAAHVTVHVPRAPYAKALPGIPTIRMFEAMACGIPLVSAPWDDAEGLFPDGSYLKARTGREMQDVLRTLLADPDLATDISAAGLQVIAERHSCRHRALELLTLTENIRGRQARPTRLEEAHL
ncbi:glycosyltransferase [Rhodopseudomonas sp. AAP120]|uniref:CgeB family protein n=1 Tax=Rhodopseudomonas sp. AAP120 TaxID=1523430 RepID=UPI0006B92665|nr:glycosyltransferase [Rhodopseudomonas sp. AAP120]KPG01670.1 glycosyltransferase [Rhodopseudomonas sp. AAP120]